MPIGNARVGDVINVERDWTGFPTNGPYRYTVYRRLSGGSLEYWDGAVFQNGLIDFALTSAAPIYYAAFVIPLQAAGTEITIKATANGLYPLAETWKVDPLPVPSVPTDSPSATSGSPNFV